MERREAMTVGRIIKEALAQVGSADEVAAHRIEAAWADVVGQGINRMTYKRQMRNGVLHIYLTSSVVKHELGFRKHSLIDALNRAAATKLLTDIQFH